MFNLDFKPKSPSGRIATDEMYDSIHRFTEALNPVDRAEKIERMLYEPEAVQEIRNVQREFGPAVLTSRLPVEHATPGTGDANDVERVTRFNSDHAALVTFGHPNDVLNPVLKKRVHFTDTAWHQLCDRIKPAPYFRQNVEACPGPLRQIVVNHFLQERAKHAKLGDRMLLFRTWEPTFAHNPILRALVTSDYIKMDDDDVLDFLRRTPEAQEALVSHFSVEEKHSTFKLVWPTRTVELKNRKAGDALCYSVDIRNSEVGAGSVSIYGGVEILSCTNGMTRQDMFCRFVHRGNRETKLRLIGESIREAARKTDDFVEDIRRSLEIEIADPFETITDFSKALGWTDDFAARVHSSYKGAMGDVLFDVTQAVTAAAKAATGTERFEREMDGGKVLSIGLAGK